MLFRLTVFKYVLLSCFQTKLYERYDENYKTKQNKTGRCCSCETISNVVESVLHRNRMITGFTIVIGANVDYLKRNNNKFRKFHEMTTSLHHLLLLDIEILYINIQFQPKYIKNKHMYESMESNCSGK